MLSGDFLDGKEYRFPGDTRPHVVVLLGEEEYNTATTLGQEVSYDDPAIKSMLVKFTLNSD